MAKRSRRGGVDAGGIGTGDQPTLDNMQGSGAGNTRTAQDTLADFAEDLGRLLGTAQLKASAWLDQRKAIAEQLTQIRDTANRYLQQLGGDRVPFPFGRRGRPPGKGATKRASGTAKRSGKKKRTMSPEARERIAEAQRRRWAKQRKEATKS